MTDTEINKRIAEYMGLDVREVCPKRYIVRGNNTCDNLPDYCNDLNVVWEVEEKLRTEGLEFEYDRTLTSIINKTECRCQRFAIRHATALQCCEAIIKVLEG